MTAAAKFEATMHALAGDLPPFWWQAATGPFAEDPSRAIDDFIDVERELFRARSGLVEKGERAPLDDDEVGAREPLLARGGEGVAEEPGLAGADEEPQHFVGAPRFREFLRHFLAPSIEG